MSQSAAKPNHTRMLGLRCKILLFLFSLIMKSSENMSDMASASSPGYAYSGCNILLCLCSDAMEERQGF